MKKDPCIKVLSRTIQVLDCLADSEDPVGLKRLAEITGLSSSTAHRLLQNLSVGRLVEKEPVVAYRLGLRLLELGKLVAQRLPVRVAAIEPMRRLHRITDQTVNLSIRQDDSVVYVERAFSERSGLQVIRAVGGAGPLHLTSEGKLFLSVDTRAQVTAYALRTGLCGHTARSITDLSALEMELSYVAKVGYARDMEELEPGVCAIAAGVNDDGGTLIASLSITAPADRFQNGWIDPLCSTASEIEKALESARF
jgi:DNA-binding IclR family transcriptional regulator